MTDRATLLALADRVEAGDQHRTILDCCIWDMLRGSVTPWGEKYTGLPYTSSLDAAMILVPAGWHVGMLTDCDEDDHPHCCLTENDDPCRDAIGRGGDMASSLCAAALRARAEAGE